MKLKIPNVGFEVKYFSNQISIHHEGQNILCDLCNKTFSVSEYLEIHIRKFHTVQESTSNLVPQYIPKSQKMMRKTALQITNVTLAVNHLTHQTI